MTLYGYNFNSLGGNPQIPSRYAGDLEKWPSVHDTLWDMKVHTDVDILRTLVWPTEVRDEGAVPSGTAWVHAPLLPQESAGVGNYAKNSPVPVMFAVGALWRLIYENEGMPQELWLPADVIAESLAGLFRQLPRGEYVDAYNEFLVKNPWRPKDQTEVLKRYWPKVLEGKDGRGSMTVSTIADNNDTKVPTVTDAYDFLRDNGGLPDHLDIHINGWSNEWIATKLHEVVEFLEDRYERRVGVGECDVELDGPARVAVASADLVYFCRWKG